MTDHTPEPWKVDNVTRDRIKILGPDRPHRQAGRDGLPVDLMYNTAVAHMFCPNETEQAANAARIVACVNACAGIPTEQLGDVKVIELVQCLALVVHMEVPPDKIWKRAEAALAPFRKD